ncbi:glycosyltransferase [Candidatus Nomurabacteria bacterium]|nr:glycosyltransferase [Candidatus Nomurabacteria bacterium]
MQNKSNQKLALVIHSLRTYGGAEYILKVISDLYPDAPIYTSWYKKEITDKYFEGRHINGSFMNSLPFIDKFYRFLIPLLPIAFKSIDLSEFDKVLVISDEFDKMVKVGAKTKKILYVLTPPRFLWLNITKKSLGFLETLYRKFLKDIFNWVWRYFDKKSAMQADQIISISKTVQERVRSFYGLDSDIMYPPVDVEQIPFYSGKRPDEFLYLGRIEGYKGVELAIRACITYGKKLRVAGIGSDLERLTKLVKEMGAENLITFEGFVFGLPKFKMYSQVQGVIFPVIEEDFGIVPVEANAAGCPVIAYRSGGVRETIIEGETGVFFDEYSEDGLGEVLMNFDSVKFSAEKCRKNAERFSRKVFEDKIRDLIDGTSKR